MNPEQNIEEEISNFWNFLDEGNTDQAEEISNKLSTEYPDNAMTFYIKGHLEFVKKQFKESVKSFEEALEKSKNQRFSSFVNYWIGEVFNHNTGDYRSENENEIFDSDKAEKHYLKSVSYEEFPSNVLDRLNNYFRENPEEALKIISESIKKYPKEIEFYLKLSDIYKYKYRDDSKYIETLHSAYDECDKSSELVILIAFFYQNTNKFEKANNYYVEALELTNDSEEIDFIHFQQGNISILTSNFEIATSELNKCINSNNSTLKFLSKLALSYSLLHESNIDKVAILIEDIDISELPYFSLEEEPFFLSRSTNIPISLSLPFQEFLELLHKLENLNKTRLDSKVSYIKSLIYKKKEDFFNQANELIKSVDILNYDFLYQEISEAIYLCLVSENFKNDAGMKLIQKIKYNGKVIESFSDYNYESIIDHFYEKNNFEFVCNFIESLNIKKETSNILFKQSYSYCEIGNDREAQKGYEKYLDVFEESSAVLNNLGNIYKREGNTSKAIELYSKAIELAPDDEIAKNNLKNTQTLKLYEEEKEKEAIKRQKEYKTSLKYLKNENKYVLEKLNNLILNLKSENEIEHNQVAIPNYKFAVLMQASKENANSLKDRFLEKGYIYKTNRRNEHRVVFYEINPLLEEEVKVYLEELNQVVEESWIKGFESITTDRLKEINYFTSLKKIERINKKFSKYIMRDFKELVFNYLVGNQKSTIVLSGSLVEFLIIYYCEKKRINTISYTNPRSMNVINRNLYDSTLFELITYANENNLFGKDFPYLGNLLRVYRNLIHPGLELKNNLGKIDKSKLEISFIGTIEILNKVI